VYFEARSAWLRERPAAPADTSRGHVDTTAAPVRSAAATPGPAPAGRPRPAAALCLLPLGGGQFANRQHAKGVVLALTQAAALAASVVSYATRANHYDATYGWYSGNAAAYHDYTVAYRVEFGLFGTGYLYGVIDALVCRARARRQ